MNLVHEIDFARRIAIVAGENAIRIRARGITAETKSDQSPVTIADKENERLIREAIESEFPEDGILGEEGASKEGTGRRRWIIDPIDGTRDFVRGNRFWCVLLGLELGDESLVGVANFPLLGELYWAAQGEGAYLNGERLNASAVTRFEESSFSPNGLQLKEARPYLPKIVEVAQKCWSYRSYGGALDACLLAAGKTDIWFEPKVAPWDLAPLKLILEESGAEYFALDGSRSIYAGTAVACARGLAAQVREAFSVPS
jgi:histidinol phosphatase-like enzyme (inositol monophosphatase family)